MYFLGIGHNFAYMTEQDVQSRKIKELESLGYYVIKLVKTNKNGIADLLALPRNCGALFCEIKRPGKKPSKLQLFRKKELEQHGLTVEVFDGT